MANNTRFLILPWVSIKYLASKILALNAKRISDDWLKVYHHPLFLLETFVEKDRFKGTCYKAANWPPARRAYASEGYMLAILRVPLKESTVTCSMEISRMCICTH